MDISHQSGDFPSGPMVKIPGFQWSPGGGTKILHAMWPEKEKKKKNLNVYIKK